jgi:hypothetical protein
MQEINGPPLSLSGFCGKYIDCFTPQEDIQCLKNSTWLRSETRPHDYRTSIVYENLPAIHGKNLVHGFKTQLTIRIPKYRDHLFWERSQQNDFFNWNSSEGIPELRFQVERWGTTEEESYYYTLQQAKNIIMCIRIILSGQPIPSLEVSPISPLTCLQCPVLSLGQQLNDRWTSIPQSSSPSENIDFLNELIQTRTDLEFSIQVRLLIQYYQVYH